MLVILGKTPLQAKAWVVERGLKREAYVIVSGVRSIEGLRYRGSDVVYLDGYLERRDISLIQDRIVRDVAIMGPGVEPCPECESGKCSNCDGRTWDNQNDEPDRCPCEVRGHPRRTS